MNIRRYIWIKKINGTILTKPIYSSIIIRVEVAIGVCNGRCMAQHAQCSRGHACCEDGTHVGGHTTTTEQVFVPSHLSRLPLDPGPKVAFVLGPTASRASGGDMGLLSWLVTPTLTKWWLFCPGWWHQPGLKDPFVPVGVTNPGKRPLHVIVQKEVILYWVTCTT